MADEMIQPFNPHIALFASDTWHLRGRTECGYNKCAFSIGCLIQPSEAIHVDRSRNTKGQAP